MAITKSTGFGGIPGMNIGVRESQQRARAFWGDVQEGDEVYNLQAIQKSAQEHMIDAIESDPRAAIMIPLVDLFDPMLLRKAVWDNTYGFEGFRQDIKKAQQDFASELDAQLRASTLKKATSTTSVSNLMHNYSDEQVVMLFKKVYPAQALIPVEANHGKVAQWDAITKEGAGTAFFGSEDPNLTESDITDAIRTATCKIMYSVMRVTKMAKIAGQTQYPARDVMAIRTLASNEMIRNLRERSIIGVNRDVTNTTPTYTAASSLEYAGLYELITANTAAPLYQTYSGGAATLDKIKVFLDESYRQMKLNGQNPNLALCDWKTFGIIGRGLNDFWRTEQVKSTNFGVGKVDLTMPDGQMPLIPINFMPATTGNYGSILLMDTSFLARRVLWSETYEELANLNTSQRGVISASEVLIDKSDSNGTNSLQGGVISITVP